MATRVWEVIGYGILADRPAATEDNVGFLYAASDVNDGTLYRSNGVTWDIIAQIVEGPPGPEGPQGPQGEQGEQGEQGDPGVGVPVGGTTGQVLAKASNADYDTLWITLALIVNLSIAQSAFVAFPQAYPKLDGNTILSGPVVTVETEVNP